MNNLPKITQMLNRFANGHVAVLNLRRDIFLTFLNE